MPVPTRPAPGGVAQEKHLGMLSEKGDIRLEPAGARGRHRPIERATAGRSQPHGSEYRQPFPPRSPIGAHGPIILMKDLLWSGLG